jgi:hypothetical protein
VTRQGAGRENGTEAEIHRAPDPRGGRAARQRRNGAGYRSDLQRQSQYYFEVGDEARVTCNAMASGDALMPIRPEYRWFYPIDWPQLSAAIRLVAQRADASIAVAHTATWSFTSGMVVGWTRKRPHGETVGAGRSPCRRIRLSRKMTGSLRPKSCWRPPTSITIRATTKSAISKPTVNAATC